MAEKVIPGPVDDARGIREAVCIHTRKITDQAQAKDCIENLRFYPKMKYVDVINRAASVKGGEAKLLHVYLDVEPVTFNRGFYSVDMRFFYEVTLQVYLGCPAPVSVQGLCVFDKRAILFGGEGAAKIYSSQMTIGETDCQIKPHDSTPIAVVETMDPIVLDAKIADCCCKHECDCDLCELPSFVCNCFDGDLCCGDDSRRIYVTLGQFSIVRLERDSQLLIPVYDYCVPSKECTCGDQKEDPCGVFQKIRFPMNEFFPQNNLRAAEDFRDVKSFCCK